MYLIIFNHTDDSHPTVLEEYDGTQDGYKAATNRLNDLIGYYLTQTSYIKSVHHSSHGTDINYNGYTISLFLHDDNCDLSSYVVSVGKQATVLTNWRSPLPESEFNRLIAGPFTYQHCARLFADSFNED